MSSLTSRLELEPVEQGTPGNESRLYIHECGHVEWWPTSREYLIAEGGINEQGCDACDSGPHPGAWRTLYAMPRRS